MENMKKCECCIGIINDGGKRKMTERERLIKLLNDRIRPWYYLLATANNIKLLADYLLANGVMVSLFKVGDKVWGFNFCKNDVIEYGIVRADTQILKDGTYHTFYGTNENNYIEFDYDDIGKTVFLTKEEAEQTLQIIMNK